MNLSWLALTLLQVPTTTPPTNPMFVDVAAQHGVASDNSARTQLIDVDGDTWPDLVIGGSPFRLLLSKPLPEGGRTFVDGTKASGLGDRDHSLMLWGDVNGDSHLDMVSIVTQNADQYKKSPQSPAVYLGDGKGHFKRQKRSGLEIQHHTATHGAVLCDLDLDGKLDIALGNQYDGASLEAQPMRVFQGNGRGRFVDVTGLWGFPTHTVVPGAAHAPRPLYGLTAADVDNDGFPELLGAAYGRQWNTLWKRLPASPFYDDMAANYGLDGDSIRHGRYSQAVKDSQKKQGIEREDELPFRTGGNNFSIVPADFDGDGDLDVFTAAITHWWAGDSSDLSCLLINRLETRHEPFFERQLEILGTADTETGRLDRPGRGLVRDHTGQTPTNWNQGDLQAHWADMDNDGLLDLLVCESDYPQNRLRLFMQQPDHSFAERDREFGLNWPNCPGVALGDYDGDGDIDIIATGSTTRWPQARPKAALALLENRLAPTTNGWLKVRLVGNGVTANANATGARVTLVTSDGRTQTRDVSGPYGHWAAQTEPGEVHFGLGTATVTSLKITWPDAKRTQTTVGVPARNSLVTIRQDSVKK
ncbi:CRTAC1 family protein [bacterium]|nr:MAG: CRTAC1 family protein [bacterium]